MKRYFVRLGRGERVSFTLPKGWQCSSFVPGDPAGEPPPLPSLLQQALEEAEVSTPIGGLARRAKRPVIVVDDLSRPTPTPQILEVLIPWLADRGVSPEEVTIVVALGTHPPLSGRQLELKLGKKALATCRVIQHDPKAPDLVPAAELSSGTAVKINPAVAEADLKVSVGSILPHPTAGFGGGKAVMPGVADLDSIREHHLSYMGHPGSTLGEVDGNGFFEESLKVAKAVGIDLLIRCLYDRAGEVDEVIAGDLEGTMRRGMGSSLAKLGHKMEQKADICIISPLPYRSGPQMLKALAAASMVTRPGGAILVVVPIGGTFSEEFVSAFCRARERCGGDPLGRIEELLQRRELILPDKPMDFNMAVLNTIRRSMDRRVVFVSGEIPRERVEAMGFEAASDIGEGMVRLLAEFPEAEVAIFPSGGLVIPLVEGGS